MAPGARIGRVRDLRQNGILKHKAQIAINFYLQLRLPQANLFYDIQPTSDGPFNRPLNKRLMAGYSKRSLVDKLGIKPGAPSEKELKRQVRVHIGPTKRMLMHAG